MKQDGLTVLPKLKKIPKRNIISLDAEWINSAKDAYVWAVCGRTEKKGVINEIFHTKESVFDFLFNNQWDNTILTGFNILVDLYTIMSKDLFKWGVTTNMGKFMFANIPYDENRRSVKIVEAGNFYNTGTLESNLKLKGKYKTNYLQYCKETKAPVHIDKHILNENGITDMIEACRSHSFASSFLLEDIQNQLIEIEGSLKLTAASTSLYLFRQKYLPRVCQIWSKWGRLPTDADKLYQNESYNGGRCEVFYEGEFEHVDHYDVNSMYPHAMINTPFPQMSSQREEGYPTPELLTKMLFKEKCAICNREGLATINVTSPKNIYIPYLISGGNGALMFPRMKNFWGTWTFVDIRKAIQLGYIVNEVERLVSYPRTKEPLFDKWVDDLYKIKQNNPNLNPVAKLLLNSLYGKFGQRANIKEGWQMLDIGEPYNPEEHKTLEGLRFKYIPKLSTQERGFEPQAYPLIAAYVTSVARRTLYEGFEAVGLHNVLYCDTDSMFVKEGYDKTKIDIHPSKLGAWSLEHENIIFQAKGKKFYRFKPTRRDQWDYTIRSIKKNTPLYLKDKYWMGKQIPQDTMTKFATAIKGNISINKMVEVFKQDQNPPKYRIFKEDGSSTPILRSD